MVKGQDTTNLVMLYEEGERALKLAVAWTDGKKPRRPLTGPKRVPLTIAQFP